MKRLLIVLSVLVLTGAGCSVMESGDSSVDANADVSAKGTITAVNLDQIAFDGPAVITIETAPGIQEEIQVPSFGINLCAGGANITDVYALKVGDQIEVRGAMSEGAIVPCESTDHYLRVEE